MKNKVKETKCPICGKSKYVGVITTIYPGTQLATAAYYCRECEREFDKKGEVFPLFYS